ncbi:GntR family transcriptional regulator [Arthrobacter livingstonensis]|uniref:GntR family transcriptional regulator n=1 Tax=Arthrobacter livingstonensis TaxID=670078 RepID=UPI001FEC13B5
MALTPGEPLTERGVETTFGASRTPARAALMRLESEGLVRRAGRGWAVSPIDLSEIQSLAELRVAVETAASRLACDRASPNDIDGVAELLDLAEPGRDEAEGVRAGQDFHGGLAALSGNPFMVDAVRGAMTRLERTRWLEVRSPEARRQAWQEHTDILAAIRAGDADMAAELITGHVMGTNSRLLATLSRDRLRLRGHGLAIVDREEP